MHAEMRDPAARPEGDAAGGILRDETLFKAIAVGGALRVGKEHLAQGGEFAHGKAEDRGLAEFLERRVGVAGQDHVVGRAVSEEGVHRAGDDKVEVEEEDGAGRAAKVGRPEA